MKTFLFLICPVLPLYYLFLWVFFPGVYIDGAISRHWLKEHGRNVHITEKGPGRVVLTSVTTMGTFYLYTDQPGAVGEVWALRVGWDGLLYLSRKVGIL